MESSLPASKELKRESSSEVHEQPDSFKQLFTMNDRTRVSVSSCVFVVKIVLISEL